MEFWILIVSLIFWSTAILTVSGILFYNIIRKKTDKEYRKQMFMYDRYRAQHALNRLNFFRGLYAPPTNSSPSPTVTTSTAPLVICSQCAICYPSFSLQSIPQTIPSTICQGLPKDSYCKYQRVHRVCEHFH